MASLWNVLSFEDCDRRVGLVGFSWMLRLARSMTDWLLRRFAFGDCFDGFDRHCDGYVTLPADSFGYATTTFDVGVEIGV